MKALKNEIIKVCRRLDSLGYVPATDGNVSARAGRGRLFITPSMVPKWSVKAGQLLLVDGRGRILSGSGKPSSEMKMHLEVYRLRPDVGAVVHAHPPVATAFAACRRPLERPILPEAVVMLGPVPLARYATPSTGEVPRSVAPYVEKGNAVLLANHGVLAYGRDLQEALERMERVEHLAKVAALSQLLGGAKPLAPGELTALKNLFGSH
jgi:L-fuculose-phosphate aldolase